MSILRPMGVSVRGVSLGGRLSVGSSGHALLTHGYSKIPPSGAALQRHQHHKEYGFLP
ncbi:hypothetical protein [Alloprevotella sp. Lung230]|uniref:hypothetical protein n=1 Tax=Alloprevotella sp. Lung230 TaxID=2766595 RepID=UPI001654E58A|nr:hypothetical protein [Alloprevotella sp. Lung230]MBC8626070.1 hypothetical protein [Alloprevotella sp. Lung230]